MNKAGVENTIKQEVIKKVTKPEHKVNRIQKAKNEISKFLKALARRESSSDPKLINSLGYIVNINLVEMALDI
jgi:hypothetical protein